MPPLAKIFFTIGDNLKIWFGPLCVSTSGIHAKMEDGSDIAGRLMLSGAVGHGWL